MGFMMPAPYGSLDHYGSPPTEYPPMSHQQQYAEPKPSSSGAYSSTYATSPGMHNQHQPRRSGEHPVLPPYQPSAISRSPYQQTLGPMRASPTPMSYPPTSNDATPMSSSASHNYSYPAIHANLPAQNINSLGSTASYPP